MEKNETAETEAEEISAAHFTTLVNRCLQDFDHTGALDKPRPQFSFVFFLTYQWYTESGTVLKALTSIYDDAPPHGSSEPGNTCKEQVCQAIHFWINQFGDDFKATTMVFAHLDTFEANVTQELTEETGSLLRTDKWIFSRNSQRMKPRSMWRKSPPLGFADLKPDDIAQQLTYLDWKGCIKIPFFEWKLYVKTAKTEGCINLKKQITLFNNISKWITAMILSKQQPEERAELMNTFILVAKELISLGNYNSLLAVMGGITHTSVGRLQKTKAYLSYEHKLFLTEMVDFLSPNYNYNQYRKKADNRTIPVIPILGVVMKDLVAIDVSFPDFKEDAKINFSKMTKVANALSLLFNLSKAKLDIVAKKELLHLLRVSLQCRLTEEELYALSLEREPRVANCKTPQPTEAPVFAEWAAGENMEPDRKTVEKHVDAMVQAVFKIYDADKNGTISKDEFENIATNFPYLENFAVLDRNCDGGISRDEMKNYFMNRNAHDMTKDFVHNFVETTFFAPTYCEYCTGFLWGIGRAGVKCKECGITCHNDCRNHVVLECRSRSYTVSAKDKPSRTRLLKRRMKYMEQQMSESNSSTDQADPPSPKPLARNASTSSAASGQAGLLERLRKSEEDRDHLYVENDKLKYDLKKMKKRTMTLERQMAETRQATVQLLIEQMNRLEHRRQTDV